MTKAARLSPIFRKYLLAFVALVSVALLASGGIEAYFSYQENIRALSRLQGEKAASAAGAIDRFLDEIERQIRAANPEKLSTMPDSLDYRRDNYEHVRLVAPAVKEIQYLDSAGTEQLTRSELRPHWPNLVRSAENHSQDPAFLHARSGQTYFGPVDFRDGSEPRMRIAVREPGPLAGVSVAEVDLREMWRVVSAVQAGPAGYAYVVDRDGKLIAHQVISLVLQNRNLAGLPQVETVLSHAGVPAVFFPDLVGRDIKDKEVITAPAVIPKPGWWVFVEQPSDIAFAPVWESLRRTGGFLLLGVLLSLLASLFLARKMVTPIQELQAGAERIGSGTLDARIEVRTGDELEELAEEFNRMAARLRDSYAELERTNAGLEQQVGDRTRALEKAVREIEQKRQQLEFANSRKDEFLRYMSHELRTPLNAVIPFSQVLLDGMAGDLNDRQAEYLTHVLVAGKHLLSLIDDILDYINWKVPNLSHFWLPDALERAVTMAREEASRQQIELTLDVDPALGIIEADERRVVQIVSNLLSNAVKFTPGGGQVFVTTTMRDSELQISVRDTGLGIAPEEQDRVFEPLYRPESSRGVPGTGLGLALVKQFVEGHGGRVWVESTVGKGSTVTFTLPIAEHLQAKRPRPDATMGRRRRRRSSASVLVIEDDPQAAELMRIYLEGAGYDVAVASDAESALEEVRRVPPSIITLDIKLPGVDGWDFLANAKADPDLARIPIVIVSMLDERARGLALGAADYLVKPVRRDELVASLRALPAA